MQLVVWWWHHDFSLSHAISFMLLEQDEQEDMIGVGINYNPEILVKESGSPTFRTPARRLVARGHGSLQLCIAKSVQLFFHLVQS